MYFARYTGVRPTATADGAPVVGKHNPVDASDGQPGIDRGRYRAVVSAPLPKLLSQASAIKLLREHGWEMERGGKHVVKMTKPGMRPITLPAAKRQDYSRGLTRRILEQAGLLPTEPR